jgi:hypothetical protein
VRVTLIVGAIITFLLFIGLGIYLITISDNLAENMAQKDPAVEISNKIEAKDLQVLAFSVVGIILIALSISKIFELGVKIFTLQCMKSDESFMEKVSIDTISSAIGFVIQFTIGILLFVFGGSVSNIWDTLKKRFQHERNMAD